MRPILSYEDIRKIADEFLGKHHPSGTIPVPIEEIAEGGLGLNIIPVPGLHQITDVDGFLSGNLKDLHVEMFVYESVESRFRFTVAHEIGHLVLHRELLESVRPTSLQDWKARVNAIPENEHGWLEWQAYSFAGLVLVPRMQLQASFRKWKDTAEGHALNPEADFVRSYIEASIARDFNVSAPVVHKRLERDEA